MDYSRQAPLSMGFSRQEYWSGLPFPTPADLLGPGIEPCVSCISPIDRQILYHCTTWEPRPLQKKFLSIWKRMTKGGPGLKSVYRRSIQCQFSSVAQSCPILWPHEFLSITNSRSLLKLMSIESVMPSKPSSVVPFPSHLQSFPASGSFQMSQLFASGGQSIGVSASTSVLPMNTQDWSLG